MIVAILQARMSSTRLPGKVLKTILGRPMLELQIERIQRCKTLDQIVVATSTEPEDSALVTLCQNMGVAYYTGSLTNVLDRFYQAAKRYRADHIVRLTGDCPLIDPVIIDGLVNFYLDQGCDYASNSRPPTLPDGLDGEVFSFHVLESAWKKADDPFHFEHVIPYILSHPEHFTLANYEYKTNYSALRWTVDHPEDFDLVKSIYETLYNNKPEFGLEDVIDLIRKCPALRTMNLQHKRVLKFTNIHSILSGS
tara:strand:- start:846 stop:1601 length:756 start_codon:yes stop_codon:yes gene_type:complete